MDWGIQEEIKIFLQITTSFLLLIYCAVNPVLHFSRGYRLQKEPLSVNVQNKCFLNINKILE